MKGQSLNTSIQLHTTHSHIYWRAKRKLRFPASHSGQRQAKWFSCRSTSTSIPLKALNGRFKMLLTMIRS